MLTNPDEIRKEWKEYFKNLYTPTEQKYNNEFKCNVYETIKEMEMES